METKKLKIRARGRDAIYIVYAQIKTRELVPSKGDNQTNITEEQNA